MLLTGSINTLTNDGAPDYNICGQATSLLSLTNINFKLAIAKDGESVVLVDTTDLSTVSPTTPVSSTFGNYDIILSAFAVDTATSKFQAEIEVFVTGTSDVVTWEKFNVILQISKSGYQSFTNVFEFYNYDVGNATGIVGFTTTTGNQDFSIILVNNTNNLDSYSRQTKAGSHFITLRKPFTNHLFAYNMIGTQGSVTYYDDNLDIIGTGNSCTVTSEESYNITQKIVLFNNEECESEVMTLKSVWFPVIQMSVTGGLSCDECVNNVNPSTASFYVDASLMSIYNLAGVPMFPMEFTEFSITENIVNYNSEILSSNEEIIALTYAAWIADGSVFLTPNDYIFTPSQIGDNVVNFVTLYGYDTIEIYKCEDNYKLSTCNWWKVDATEECNVYKVSNCAGTAIDVTVQKLNETQTFDDLSTVNILAYEDTNITFEEDGIYMLKVVKTVDLVTTTQYYSLPIYCSLKECLLKYLKKVICTDITDNCVPEDNVNFNSLISNVHTYFLLLNEELNYNYIYTTISAEKITELYTLQTFIDNFTKYCEDSDSPCTNCE